MRRSLKLICLSLFLSGLASAADLAGVDADRNGIRDDIDQYIAERTPAQSAERTAAQAYARALQSAVTGQQSPGALSALVSLRQQGSDWSTWARDLRELTVNTGARLDAYAAALDRAGPQFLPLQPGGEQACPNRACTVVVFQNGILTSEDAALRSLLALRQLLGDTQAGQRLLYALNYNPTEGVADLVEVFRQKFGEHDRGAAAFAGTMGAPDALAGVMSTLLQAKLRATTSAVPTTLGGWVSALTQPSRTLNAAAALPTPAELSDVTRQYTSAYLGQVVHATVDMRQRLGETTYMDDNATALADGLEAYLRRGLRVVLVAHSQGNLYAEVVQRELKRRGVPLNRFAVVGVAVPNGESPAGGRYVSTQADLVLGALRILFPVLAANDRTVAPVQPGSAFLGHGFVDVYTRPGSPVAERVVGAIRDTITDLSGQ